MSLTALPTQPHIATSTSDVLASFYIPALKQSSAYDRGVGFFTSQWLRLAASGLAGLAANGGHARIIASPMLDPADCAALAQGSDAREDPILKNALDRTISDLERDLASDTLAALAWMIADGLLDFRIAIPTADLDGDFHDKFGIFRDGDGNAVAFHGSPNDSAKAFRNYESISIYYSWIDAREAARVTAQAARFDLLWANGDINLRVYPLPDAVKRNLIAFTTRLPRPYSPPSATGSGDRWVHQRKAAAAFLEARHGILEMATGTGKTRTALSILNELRERDLVETAIVTAYGTDLLDQWYKELVQHGGVPVYRAYDQHHEAQAYLNSPRRAVLLTARANLSAALPRLDPRLFDKALLICDEVHGMGSQALVTALKGKLQRFAYRLGLSATPERAYDAEGNRFIDEEIGPVLFRFGLTEAIERGILCEFDYVPLPYALSDGDKAAVRQAIKRYHAKARSGQPAPIETLYRDIARVRKLSQEKIAPFEEYVAANPSVVERCIIFVETAEYGALIQPLLMRMRIDFHTYYQDDDREKLRRFARGELDCLLTCHRISEGIDIQSVNNIVLFASSRARLETVQRLGRCLRIDPTNPDKRARVVDFVEPSPADIDDPTGEMSADEDRAAWFTELAAVRYAGG
jgi:superfamily II DNA or RNA helicase